MSKRCATASVIVDWFTLPGELWGEIFIYLRLDDLLWPPCNLWRNLLSARLERERVKHLFFRWVLDPPARILQDFYNDEYIETFREFETETLIRTLGQQKEALTIMWCLYEDRIAFGATSGDTTPIILALYRETRKLHTLSHFNAHKLGGIGRGKKLTVYAPFYILISRSVEEHDILLPYPSYDHLLSSRSRIDTAQQSVINERLFDGFVFTDILSLAEAANSVRRSVVLYTGEHWHLDNLKADEFRMLYRKCEPSATLRYLNARGSAQLTLSNALRHCVEYWSSQESLSV
jgi:hypothetical protein